MRFKIRTFIGGAGNELSVLVDENNHPLFWPNVFATMEFRSKSPKTLSAALRALGMFELCRESKELPSSNDLASGTTLSIHDAEALAMFLQLTRPAQDEEALTYAAISKRKVVRLESVRKSNTNKNNSKRYAGKLEAANRIRWVAKYLEYLRDRSISVTSNRAEQQNLERKANVAIKRLRRLTPRVSTGTGDESLVGIDDDIIRHIGDTLNPLNTSPQNNPFGSDFLRARNHLIWSILAETGMRREEMVKLKVDDVDYSTHRIRIRESKTLPRTVPISDKTAQAFHNFIMNHWSKLQAKATAHGRLFIGENGSPLQNGTVNLVFSRIREGIADVPQNLTPHTLRRSWNERYSARIDALPTQQRPSESEELQIRNRLMGWSDRSQMGARYAKRHIQRKADSIAEDLANTLAAPEVKTDDKQSS